MEKGRHMVQCIVDREEMKRQSLELDQMIFQRRAVVKDTKRRLGIKGDDEDLVNRPRKQRPVEAPPQVLRPVIRQDGRPPEADLRQLDDLTRAHRQITFKAVLETRARRQAASVGQYDRTLEAINNSLAGEQSTGGKKFRAVRSYYLPSPPPSESPSSSPDSAMHFQEEIKPKLSFQTTSPYGKRQRDERSPPPKFRRRIGRGGRLMVDRRGMKMKPEERDGIQDIVLDRFKYDQDSEEEEDYLLFSSFFNPSRSDS